MYRALPILVLLMAGLEAGGASLEAAFTDPPDSARPGVYWYFMDGNLSEEEMRKDLESMAEVGIGNLVFLEVNVGVPRGPVEFMSDEWQALFAKAVRHAERLGIDITLGAGPGWTGSGGPWVPAEQSMQHLVFSTVEVTGPRIFDETLPVPEQRSTQWHQMRSPFYEDVLVYAFPSAPPAIEDINEKALYERNPYTSMPGVKPYLPAPAIYQDIDDHPAIDPDDLIDLTGQLDADGRLRWEVPAGDWTILRMGRRSTGASTRPAPEPGVGFDHDKFDRAALEDHFANYYGVLLDEVGPRAEKHGWTAVHLDSWEMGAQNWTPRFMEEFEARRGYDPKPYLPAFSGRVVRNLELSERFLWDVRLTAQELVLENYAGHLKTLGREHGFELSIEPYDMNPTADLDLGAVADVPMCEFWSAGYGFDSSFSCIEATSIAHVMGRPIVSAEAFTGIDQWQQYPWSMKNQGDWAFAMGINRFVYHTFAHKPLGDEHRPGMTMGPYGVHWDRGQTWWPLVHDYHTYVTRCSHLMRQGVAVSDILYLTPEGAPHVFRPPVSALEGEGPLADKKGYGFDGCSPNMLMDRAAVNGGRITFPGGSSYRILVLPRYESMTPALLEKIIELVEAGAVVYGAPPVASPSLTDYPACDREVQGLASTLWGETPSAERRFGKGRVILDSGALSLEAKRQDAAPLLPHEAAWIWFDAGQPEKSAPEGDVHFRYAWQLSYPEAIVGARVEATADNAFELRLNGSTVLSGDNFNVVYSAEVADILRAGENTISVLASNAAADFVNPAGFIAAIRIRYADGKTATVRTGPAWEASRDNAAWTPAQVLGDGTMPPWNLKPANPDYGSGLYPDYGAVAKVLEAMGVPEDFHSDGPIRYGHRRTDEYDIYFVANTKDERVETTCNFRVTRGVPELWDPITAEMRGLPKFTHEENTTAIPMRFEPYQSFFVLFPRGVSERATRVAGETNFPDTVLVQTLEGPWSVAFDPEWGGPAEVNFDTLQDWTGHDERGIKYYSGIATYSKAFSFDGATPRPLYLDLGTVHDMARVRLNGMDLGAAWCAPWRIDVTDAIRPGTNVLEIDVANRWPNRLLGDERRPDRNVRTVQWESGLLEGRRFRTGRYTFATRSGPDKLFPSGLLGPVTLQAERTVSP